MDFFNIAASAKIADGASIGQNAVIEDGAVLTENAVIGDKAHILPYCVIDGAVGENSTVGPFAHLRRGSVVGKNCRIGNFVEIKNAHIGDGTKISHLSYVGDADIGKNGNVGCGVTFANYDGKEKHRSAVGDNAFIGCHCCLIAPVTVGNNCFIAAATVVTENVGDDSFVIGRVRQTEKKRR